MAKQKLTKQKQSAQDREERRKFILVLAISTIVLMIVMYLAFAR